MKAIGDSAERGRTRGTATSEVQDVDTTDTERTLARKRIERRRGLQGRFVACVVIIVFLVGIWALTGGGYFWPVWIIAGCGMAMLLGLWDYYRGPVTEADIDCELRRMQR